jgi:hypothetical protein
MWSLDVGAGIRGKEVDAAPASWLAPVFRINVYIFTPSVFFGVYGWELGSISMGAPDLKHLRLLLRLQTSFLLF